MSPFSLCSSFTVIIIFVSIYSGSPITSRRRSDIQRLGVHQLHIQAIRGFNPARHAHKKIAPPVSVRRPRLSVILSAPPYPTHPPPGPTADWSFESLWAWPRIAFYTAHYNIISHLSSFVSWYNDEYDDDDTDDDDDDKDDDLSPLYEIR